MELYDVMRTTFSGRDFLDEPVDDETLERIFENARFAPSGGNRQGWHVIVVRDQATKDAISELNIPAARRYVAMGKAGEGPLNTVYPSSVDDESIAATKVPPQLTEPARKAPVLLVVTVDLGVVASSDSRLPRVGVISGASIYPFAWNILLAARNEGLTGTTTTLSIACEPQIQALLGIPAHHAVAAVIPMGKPVKQLTKLRRRPVNEFVTRERFDGEAFGS